MMFFAGIAWISFFIRSGTKDYLDNYQIIENILILLVVIYYYYEQIIKLNVNFIYTQRDFWIVTAYFLFVSGIFFLIVYIPSLGKEEAGNYYALNYVFTIIRTIFLSIGLATKPATETIKKNYNSPY